MNKATILGEVLYQPEYSHTSYGKRYYKTVIVTRRYSDALDQIPVIMSEKLVKRCKGRILIEGSFRSRNEDGKLILYVFANYIKQMAAEDVNEVYIDGLIVKDPIYRLTPLGREITDLIIAVPRGRGAADYIPCVCWGRDSRYIRSAMIGDEVTIRGRFQSRTYEKENREHIAYELSVSEIY